METWLIIFTGVAALAIVLQMLILFGIFQQVKASSEKMTTIATDLHARLTPILSRLQTFMDDAQPRLSSAAADAAEITHLARIQAERIDRVFAEAVDRLRLQVLRADQILTGALEEIENTGQQIKNTVLGPVQEASAFIKGIKAGLDFLRSARKGSGRGRGDQSEELFI
ncbi:MAG TPA: hypothetical protein VNL38_00155 [Candidatus Nitrosotenuis sp.]|nr:hypothetical protein [Candidatus Nitrosotenuis sp.]